MKEPKRGRLPGLSSDDESRIAGAAMGGHIWDQMESVMGGPGALRQAYVTEAWADAHKGWQGHQFDEDQEYPTVKLPGSGGWEGRYTVGGPYLEVHRGGQPVEALHMDSEDRHPEGVKRRLNDWISESSQDYL